MATATMTSKGQITIPKSVRETLRLQTGDRVEFVLRGPNEAILKPMTKSIDEVFGMLHKPGMRKRTVEELNQAIARRMKRGRS